MILALNVGFIGLVAFLRPYNSKLKFLEMIFYELLLLCANICVTIIVSLSDPLHPTSLDAAEGVLVLTMIGNIATVIFCVVGLIKSLWEIGREIFLSCK